MLGDFFTNSSGHPGPEKDLLHFLAWQPIHSCPPLFGKFCFFGHAHIFRAIWMPNDSNTSLLYP
jgi:hypothetical protein